ncbi:MAG TPA: glycosyltransferase family 2 protein [Gaiellaceae bacterium]|nr:glycosyltransferase family 2 protein [Gaiellaceae bacterium]
MGSRRHPTAVLIACRNGEGTIGATVRSAVGQADVFVVSDGSSDGTARVAAQAGARVMSCRSSGGKPAALRKGSHAFELARRYRYVAVLDDDTTIDPGYIAKLTARLDADPRIAAASGRIDALWDHTRRWNPFIAMRAFMYWSYQVTIKRGQNALRAVNVICGANTVFRADVFERLIDEDVPYAIDDMFWLAEIVRRRLGRVEYVHSARSWTIDPHTFRDWYRQSLRWSWAQFQSVRGHRLGRPLERVRGGRFPFRVSWFDVAYLTLLLDWLPYMLEPLLVVPAIVLLRGWIDPVWWLVVYAAASVAWIGVAAAALRKPRLLVLAPVLLVLDVVYRVIMLHAAAKAVLAPTIEVCKWDSPERFELEAEKAQREPLAVLAPAPTTSQPT